VVNPTEVLAVEVEDVGRAGAHPVRLERTTINIEYMYAFPFGHGDRAVLIFRFDHPDGAAQALQASGINVLAKNDLFNR